MEDQYARKIIGRGRINILYLGVYIKVSRKLDRGRINARSSRYLETLEEEGEGGE
jgi:hypothetical protein